MDKKKVLKGFMERFRVNCNYRFSFMPPDSKEMKLPMHIYNDSYKEAKDEIINEFKLSKDEAIIIDRLYEFFVAKLKEKDNFNIADDITIKAIEEDDIK